MIKKIPDVENIRDLYQIPPRMFVQYLNGYPDIVSCGIFPWFFVAHPEGRCLRWRYNCLYAAWRRM